MLPIIEAERVLTEVDSDITKKLNIQIFKTNNKWKEIQNEAEEKALGLSKVQTVFKKQLLKNVKQFKKNISEFQIEWNARGPVCSNLHPRIAINRLIEFRAKFDRHVLSYNVCNLGKKFLG